MNIFRSYNKNRKEIWFAIIAIIFIIIAIKTINLIVKNSNEARKNINKNMILTTTKENKIPLNETITNEAVKEEKELIIDQFIRYCNNREIELAYNLLSSDCKEKLFPTKEVFIRNYYNSNFSQFKLYSKERFYNNTYLVKLHKNYLETGIIDNTNIQDYYTIVKQENETKLNIAGYIETKKVNNSYKDENVKIKVLSKDVYKEYETYNIEISNLTYNTILLDTKKSTKSIYLTGNSENVKYYAYSYEIRDEDLEVAFMATKVINIRFIKEYTKTQAVSGMVFSNVIYDNSNMSKTNKVEINM